MSSESDIRVPEAKRGRVPCRNEDERRTLACSPNQAERGLVLVRNLHGHAVEGDGVAGVQLLAACFLNVAVDLYQAVLNDLACLRAVLYEVGELEELAEADHIVANKNFFHAS